MGLPSLNTTLTEMQCGTCGVWHAIPRVMYDSCVSEGGYWYCPNGHQRGFNEGSIYNENKKLKRQLEQERKRKEWAEKEAENSENRRRAQKAATTRLQNRIKAGVCPCCHRTFKQLAAHMKNKHPNYTADLDRPTPVLGQQDPD